VGVGPIKTAVIVHGTPDKEEWFDDQHPSCSNSHWIPWLQKQLLIAGYHAETPEMPLAYWPVYQDWKEHFERFPVGKDSILVGHSCGGGFLLRYLSEHAITPARVVLVAPWLDPLKSRDAELFNFSLDETIGIRTDLHILYSDNDMESVDMTVSYLKTSLSNIKAHLFSGYGHFCLGDMKTGAFPDLLHLCLNGYFKSR
jgi:hypothetical protein